MKNFIKHIDMFNKNIIFCLSYKNICKNDKKLY